MLEITASRISNVVTFTTDFKSLQKAKNEVDKLQKKMQGIKPVQVAAARQKDFSLPFLFFYCLQTQIKIYM